MGYRLSLDQWDQYLKALARTHSLMGPIRQKGKGAFSDTDVIAYGPITSATDLVLDEKSRYAPKEAVFPVRETLFRFLGDEAHVPDAEPMPLVLFLRPCDIHGLDRLDTIFLKNGPEQDFYYLRRRRLLKLMLIECTTGFDSCFCVSMGTNRSDAWDGAFRIAGGEALVTLRDVDLATALPIDAASVDFEPAFIEENRVRVTPPPPEAITPELFNHPVWTEYTDRCIACGRCNTSCVTCSCFTMQDVKTSDDGVLAERRRVWAGCHVDGFTDMAGGHGFRRKNGERMRFKTLHKIHDFKLRFGTHMCVGCGRCDDVCPEYISFSACIGKLATIAAEGQQHEKSV